MKHISFDSLVSTLTHDIPPLHSLLKAFPYLNFKQRKAILTCTQTQMAPMTKSTLRRRVAAEVNTEIHLPYHSERTLLLELLEPADRYLRSKVFSGLISMLVRNAPFPRGYAEVFGVLEEGVSKEILAGIESRHNRDLNWDCIFSSSRKIRSEQRIHPDYPYCPELQDLIFHSLSSARGQISTMRLYPDYSRKTVGKIASKNMESWLDIGSSRIDDMRSTMGLEWIYHKFGVRLDGPTEIRWAWKYNQLKPRVYYARGPDQYYASRYIQEIFNVFIDSLSVTNRFERFHTTSLRGDEGDRGFVYDYSSFTSLLDEIRQFLNQLSTFCRGTRVQIVDSFHGIMSVDLGDLLDDYYEACSNYPCFDATMIFDLDLSDPTLLNHSCGMLGVPGNISSCTLLHGIHLALIVKSILKAKCVGDDACGFAAFEDEYLENLLVGIGDIAMPKVNIWEESEETDGDLELSWNYVKRPIDKIQNRFVIGEQIIFPPAAILLSWTDPIHTVIRPEDRYSERKKITSMLLSFALQFSRFQVEDDELLVSNRFIRSIDDWTREETDSDIIKRLVVPRSIRSRDVIGDLIEDYWNCIVRIPEFGEDVVLGEADRGITFIGRSNRMLKLIRDMGYGQSDMRLRSVVVREEEDAVRTWLDGSYNACYDIFIDSSCPDWMFDIYVNSSVYVSLPDPESEDD